MDNEGLAKRLTGVAGSGPLLCVGEPDVALIRHLRLWGLEVRAEPDARTVSPGWKTLALMGRAIAGQPEEIARMCRRLGVESLILCPGHCASPLVPEEQPEGIVDQWTAGLINAGFRRHLRAFRPDTYASLNEPGLPDLLAFELLSEEVLSRFPPEHLRDARDLHMDMTREAGGRADAHLARYALAAGCIRSGDTVLDCACGLGYGTALMREISPGARFIGVDGDPEAVAYGSAVFGGRAGIEFYTADARRLEMIEDASIDFIASFETLEHLEDYEAFLSECRRVLKPDGRLLASVPNLWVNDQGVDPNPHHFHVFDLARLQQAVSREFIVEGAFFQTAPGGMKHVEAGRQMYWVTPEDAGRLDPEWWIVMASRDPLERGAARFNGHPAHDISDEAAGAVIFDYARHYENPWVQRSLVEIERRLAPEALLSVCNRVMETAAPDSPELGAALCVTGYETLRREGSGPAARLLVSMESYLRNSDANPHVLRWKVSLAFLAGRISILDGRRAEARRYFEATSRLPFLKYSPTMGTKVCGALIQLALIAWGDGDAHSAEAHLHEGVRVARECLQSPWDNVTGSSTEGSPGQLIELAEIARMGDECLAALQALRRGRKESGGAIEILSSRFQGAVNVAESRMKETEEQRGQLDRVRAAGLEELGKERTLRDALLTPSRWRNLESIQGRTLRRKVQWAEVLPPASPAGIAFELDVSIERAEGEWIRIVSIGEEPPRSVFWLCLNAAGGFFHLGTAAGGTGWRTVDSASGLFVPGRWYSITALASGLTGELVLRVNEHTSRTPLPEGPIALAGTLEAGSERALVRFRGARLWMINHQSQS